VLNFSQAHSVFHSIFAGNLCGDPSECLQRTITLKTCCRRHYQVYQAQHPLWLLSVDLCSQTTPAFGEQCRHCCNQSPTTPHDTQWSSINHPFSLSKLSTMTTTEGSSDRWPPHFPSDKQAMPELGRQRASNSFSLHLGKHADSAPVAPQGPAIKEGRASILRSNSPKIGAEMDVKLPTHDRSASASATSKTFSMNARTLSSLSESSLALPSSRNASVYFSFLLETPASGVSSS
jgi:hypothetical protein